MVRGEDNDFKQLCNCNRCRTRSYKLYTRCGCCTMCYITQVDLLEWKFSICVKKNNSEKCETRI